MRIALTPHITPYFGQDFTASSLMKRLQLTPTYLENGKYSLSIEELGRISLIISRYPDRQSDLDIFRLMYTKVPLIAHVHLNYDFLTTEQKSILRETLALANVVLTNSKILKEQYKNLFPQYDWQFVNNGIDSQVYFPASEEEQFNFRERHGIKKDQLVLSFTGRLHNAKGLQLIRAFCNQINANEKYVLAIQTIDHPKYASTCQDFAKFKNVIIVHDQRERIVRYADISIHPSLSETTSLVILESLFSGVPVICSDVADFYKEIENRFAPFEYFSKFPIKDHIKKNENGKLEFKVTENSVGYLVNTMIARLRDLTPLTRNQKLRLAEGMENSPFTFSKMAIALENIYRDSVIYFRMEANTRSFQTAV
jgi:glycosyltransferase involved in cell wall biosynthesis